MGAQCAGEGAELFLKEYQGATACLLTHVRGALTKMSMTCTICRHPQRKEIEAAMPVTSVRDIAGHYNVKRMAVHRHKQSHLLPRVLRAAERRADLSAEKLVERLVELAAQTDALLDESIADRDRRSAGILIGEVRRNVNVLARVVGAPWADQPVAVNDNRVQIALTGLSTDQIRALVGNLASRAQKRDALPEGEKSSKSDGGNEIENVVI